MMTKGCVLRPLELIGTARRLAAASPPPTEADLRRAVSTAYYAMFHCLDGTAADLLIGSKAPAAWQRVYRGLDHGAARNQCLDRDMVSFSTAIQAFASWFLEMQAMRHAADYDPGSALIETDVREDIETTAGVIAAFDAVAAADRKAFCAFVLFRKRG